MKGKIRAVPSPAQGFLELIGLEFTRLETGFSRSELEITAALLNPYDTLHGGVIYSLADTGMGGALSTCLGADERCATIEIKINYLKSIRSGRLTCDTRLVHQGKGIAFLESVVKDGKGALLATAMGTFHIFAGSSKATEKK